VLLNDLSVDWGGSVEFRLTYDGPLLAELRDRTPARQAARAEQKHAIRRVFHRQLKRLWEVPPLGGFGQPAAKFVVVSDGENKPPLPPHSIDNLSQRFVLNNHCFVPLVTETLEVLCGLDILILRRDPPGGLIRAGDIDNRFKTLFDALRMPKVGELPMDAVPSEGETPFFCLLEEDHLVTKVALETDLLLEPSNNSEEGFEQVQAVITVRLRPYRPRPDNMKFG
jgi:hypothetical protein